MVWIVFLVSLSSDMVMEGAWFCPSASWSEWPCLMLVLYKMVPLQQEDSKVQLQVPGQFFCCCCCFLVKSTSFSLRVYDLTPNQEEDVDDAI